MLIKEESGRINFIDKNDAFVGFDFSQSCCEDFGWYAAKKSTSEIPLEIISLDGFWFDISNKPKRVSDEITSFRCINDKKEILHLHLYNHHNGYYSHGWESSWGCEGYL